MLTMMKYLLNFNNWISWTDLLLIFYFLYVFLRKLKQCFFIIEYNCQTQWSSKAFTCYIKNCQNVKQISLQGKEGQCFDCPWRNVITKEEGQCINCLWNKFHDKGGRDNVLTAYGTNFITRERGTMFRLPMEKVSLQRREGQCSNCLWNKIKITGFKE